MLLLIGVTFDGGTVSASASRHMVNTSTWGAKSSAAVPAAALGLIASSFTLQLQKTLDLDQQRKWRHLHSKCCVGFEPSPSNSLAQHRAHIRSDFISLYWKRMALILHG
jgi:hypothetical protein